MGPSGPIRTSSFRPRLTQDGDGIAPTHPHRGWVGATARGLAY